MAAGLRVSKLKGQRVLVVEVFDELGFRRGYQLASRIFMHPRAPVA